MECNCNNNNSNGGVIPWVRGNRLPLIICVYENVVTQEQVGDSTLTVNEMTRVPYTIQDNDTVTVTMKSGFRQVEMPFTTDGNKVMVTDNGELPTGAYTVEVTIERGDGARGRWQETRQVRVYENTSDAQLGEMYAIEADLFFWAKGDTGNGIADITSNPDDTLTITMTDGTTYTTQAMKGDKGDQGEKGTSIVSFDVTGQTDTSVIYTVTFSDDTTEEVAVPKGPQGDTGLTGNGIASTTLNSDYTLTVNYTDGTSYTTPSIRGAQGVQGVSVIGFTQTGETETNTVYNLVFSDGRTQSVAIPKGAKGDKGDTGNTGPQGSQGPKGDTVTATDYTLYNVQGSSSEGAMSQDATTKAISAQTGYYVCETVAGTAAKVVTVESGNLYKRTLGGHFKVKMTNANTAASGVTLQIGSETATPLLYNGEAVSASNSWEANEVISVYFDGTNYYANNVAGGGGGGGDLEGYLTQDTFLAYENKTYEGTGWLDSIPTWTKLAGYIKNGEVVEGNHTTYVTDFLPTIEGDIWTIACIDVSAWQTIHYYDSNHDWISSVRVGTNKSGSTAAVPSGVAYVRFCCSTIEGFVRKNIDETDDLLFWNSIYGNTDFSYTFVEGTYTQLNNNIVRPNHSASTRFDSKYSNIVPTKAGDKFAVTSDAAGGALSYIVYDIRGFAIVGQTGQGSYELTIPDGGYYVQFFSLGTLSVVSSDVDNGYDAEANVNAIRSQIDGITITNDEGFYSLVNNALHLNTNLAGVSSNKISCLPGWIFYLTTDSRGSCLDYVMYNRSGIIVASETGIAHSTFEITIPDDVYGIRFFGLTLLQVSCNKMPLSAVTIDMIISGNPLWGKNLTAVGDSITSGTSSSEAPPWPNLIAARNNMGISNCAVSGSNIAGTYTNLIAHLTADTDYFVMMEGHNDNTRVDVGTIDDEYEIDGTATFYGYLNAVMRHCLTVNPAMKILVITPTYDWNEGKIYNEAVIAIAKKWGTGLLNLYDNFMFPISIQRERNPAIGVCAEAISLRNGGLLKDGIHPNKLGHEIFSKQVEGYMKLL